MIQSRLGCNVFGIKKVKKCSVVRLFYFVFVDNSMLSVKKMSFAYRPRVPIFAWFDLEIAQGELTVLYGPSWKGKTTLLKILGGLREPQSGAVFFEKQNIYALPYDQLLHYRGNVVWFHFQDYGLLYDCSVRDNILLPFALAPQATTCDSEWFDYLVDYLQLHPFLETNVADLSGGQQERVSLVRAMIHKPRVLLLDEPGANLHKPLAQKLYALIQDYASDHYVVVATHDEHFISMTKHSCSID